MFKLDKNTGNITCFQGDSGELFLYNLPDNAMISFSAYNSNRVIIFESTAETNNADTNKTRVFISPDDTDKLTVPKRDEYAEYYYGIKLTKLDGTERIEQTFLLNDDASELNILNVYPKRSEGVNNISEVNNG